MDDIRKSRIENEIKEKLSQMIARGEIKDPRIGTLTTISRVDVTRDLSFATIYVSSLFEGDSLSRIVSGFKSASGFIRTELARRLSLRHMPELRFVADESVSESFYMVRKLETLVPQDLPDENEHGEDP